MELGTHCPTPFWLKAKAKNSTSGSAQFFNRAVNKLNGKAKFGLNGLLGLKTDLVFAKASCKFLKNSALENKFLSD
ncbi:MAG: hypothetical protein ACOVOV_09800 [Dolichospermum sp.]